MAFGEVQEDYLPDGCADTGIKSQNKMHKLDFQTGLADVTIQATDFEK